MQSQGHFQVISNLIDRGMNPQEALDALRFCIYSEFGDGTPPHGKDSILLIEDKYRVKDIERDLRLKHEHKRVEIVRGDECAVLGRGHIISKDSCNGEL